MKNRPVAHRKSIAVIGEGLTERCYIESLRITEHYRFQIYPGLPKHSDIKDMVHLCQKKIQEGYDYVICLVDMDVILSSKEKEQQYIGLKKKNPKIIFIESNACIEYWFLMHFMQDVSSKAYPTCDSIIKDLRKYLPNYSKTEDFFKTVNLYKTLIQQGDLDNALLLSRQLEKLRKIEADVYKSYSQMYRLFDVVDECLK